MSAEPFSVVIAGGGVAGLEGALALRDLAGDRVSITVIEPRDELVYRPMTVQEPFAYAAAERYPLERIVRGVGAELVRDSFESVDRDTRTAYTASGHALA